MKNVVYDESLFNSRLSFQPLLNTLKKNINDGKPGAQKLYGELIEKVEAIPELLQPFSDLSLAEPYEEIIEMLLATLFPPSLSEKENLYAVSIPFKFKAIYSSRLFQHMFLKPGSNEIAYPYSTIGHNLIPRNSNLLISLFSKNSLVISPRIRRLWFILIPIL